MNPSAVAADERVKNVAVTEDTVAVDLMDGRTIIAPLAWYPRLLKASPEQRQHWDIAGGGYGIHWPEVEEDLTTEGLLRGAASPQVRYDLRPSRKRGAAAARSSARK
ncbi:MAG: DUF2442 domain-containing protein [Dehalococcoidia bacterium]|nr:DUF2442 domain-containing protein [Dehalococcoidia bacterium]